jgi:type IV pilus assembly protein PilY1
MNTVLIRIRNLALGTLLSGALLPVLLAPQVQAEVSNAVITDYTAYPIIVTESATPLVMLAMSKDHQYWFKAYNDYTDLDVPPDGQIESTYKHAIDYFGYFDPYKCYDYDDSKGRFVPKDFTKDKYCDSVSGEWSGNFLNWATMTRMDIVRKILYGGKRSIDTSTETVLERAQLPNDAHSFAKYYDGDDISKLTPFSVKTRKDYGSTPAEDVGLTLCNTTVDTKYTSTTTNDTSQSTTEPPLIRVAKGNFSLWASNEIWQCRWREEVVDKYGNIDFGKGVNSNDPAASGIDAHADSPYDATDAIGKGDYIARVEVCNDPSLINADNNEGCREYPNGDFKPIGLIQQYGEDDLIHFGLMTGSWAKNISGGVLRKNVGSIADEVSKDTDGTFIPPSGNDAGIIDTLSRMRVYGYRYDKGNYLGSKGDNCSYLLTTITEGECTSWGNPISELYLEAIRYFAGLQPTPAFALAGSGDHFNLRKTPWVDPLTSANACVKMNTVVFNASVSSYDDDQMSGADLPGTPDFAKLTDTIGDDEGITGNKYFIGRNGTNNNEICDPKSINGLGEALGLCPEAPTVHGSYLMSGAAWWAHTNDLRSDLSGDQTLASYAVALSTNVPKVNILLDPKDPSKGHVTLLPAYQNLYNPGDVGGGELVDFKIVQPQTETSAGSGIYTGKLFTMWEDSEEGGDYDQDQWGIIQYQLDTNMSPPTLTVTTDVIAASSIPPQLFGFIISGTTQDGFHAYSGVFDADYTDPTGVPGCNKCNLADAPASYKFTVGKAAAGLLDSPLFFAAKWGGFTDENGNGKPDLESEWDRKDTNGNLVAGGDGVPDNYFFVTNPNALQKSLTQVFENIVERTASGTAAAVVANTQSGAGAAFQALYEPLKQDSNNNKVKWLGNLHALWLDDYGYLREDNPGGTPNGKLDDYNTDPVVEIFFDQNDRKTKIRRFTSSDNLKFIEQSSTVHKLTDLSPIWSAREQLSPKPDFTDAEITTQRSYTASADNGRYIFTWIDKNLDGAVDSGEQVPFDSADIDASNYGYFDVASVADAQNLVDYIRGKEMSAYRNRTVDIDGDGTTEVMRLGDVIHSTPTPVGTPSEAFDVLFGDLSYATFRSQYANRRQVIYVGANDGMLHAFNAGFYDSTDKEFKLQLNGETQHPLGAELWAYAPRNLLPHLKWLADPGYTHVYYVDGKPRVFDAKIFPPDATHPGGWGTVLVVGFRLGGGPLTTDTAGDGLGANNTDGDASDDVTMRSAYAVLDITDPEQPPQVLGEITHPDLAYTTSYPAVAYFKSSNSWYLVFGSGPTELGTATSTQHPSLFAFRMGNDGTRVKVDLLNGFARNLTTVNNGFVGDPLIVDWDLDGNADTLYFGTVDGTADSPGGHLRRLDIGGVDTAGSWPQSKRMLDTGQPFIAQPVSTLDERGRRWIYASTGRLFVNADRASAPQQTLYGLIDGTPNSFPVNGSGFVDTTSAEVFADGSVNNVTDPGGSTISTFSDVVDAVATAGGWKYHYTNDGTNPAERGVVNSALVGGVLFNPAFTPSEDLCGSEGTSRLLGLYYKTGTALSSPQVFGGACINGGNSCTEDELESLSSISLGAGLASAPSVHAGSNLGQQKITVVEQTSTGAIVLEKATTAGGVLSGEVSWRQHTE